MHPFRAVLRFLGWIAPESDRGEWFDRWNANLVAWQILHRRGELKEAAGILGLYRDGVRDALALRIRSASAQAVLHGPGFVLGASTSFLILMAVCTHGFRGARSSLVPPPIQDPAALVAVQYSGRPTERAATLGRLIPFWREKSAFASDIAGYRYAYNVPRAWVSWNFFSVLGTPPAAGRLFQPGDRNAALLSYPAWRSIYHANPRIVGESIAVEGQAYTVVGVLPELFWALSPIVDVWTPLNLDPQPPRPGFRSGAVARLRPGATAVQLGMELAALARAANVGQQRAVRVVSFNSQLPGVGNYLYLFGTIFAMISGLVLVAREHRQTAAHGWRYWTFLAAKTTLSVAIPLLAWMESEAFFRTYQPVLGVGAGIGRIVALLVFIGACSRALWWTFADQRRRCPACLRQLTMPVTFGSPASVFEPALTELICPNGHGALSLPENETDWPDRWVVLDSSWGELFKNKST